MGATIRRPRSPPLLQPPLPMFFSAGRPHRIDPDHLVVTVDGRGIRVAIKRNARAKRYGLRVPTTGGDPVLTIPPGGRFSEALSFAERHKGWIISRLERLPERIAFEPGAVVPVRGVDHVLHHVAGKRGTVWSELIDGVPHLCVAGDAAHVARRVSDYLKREAKKDLTAAVALHAGRLGVKPAAMTIKDTKSRWGSCSAQGALAFSWRVILAPPTVLDYLAAHEVAHLREMNHSARFWRLVRETCPGSEAARHWLKHHGARLHAFG